MSGVSTPAQHLAFAQAIHDLRHERGLSQEELALRSGIDRSHMGRIERGVQNPRLATIFKVSKGLGVPASSVFAHSERVMEARARRSEP